MKENLKIDPVQIFWRSLNQTVDLMHKAREKELIQYGITPIQAAALFTIQMLDKEESTISEIARWLSREPHSVANLLTRMERYNLVTKEKTKNKKKITTYRLTKKGLEAYSMSLKLKSIRNALSALSTVERKNLGIYLKKMRDESIRHLRQEVMKPIEL
jgi:MarR family transcriptional regulator, 2-MHQ and catechol-resistance regulon repressor